MEPVSWRIDDYETEIIQFLSDLGILQKRFFRWCRQKNNFLVDAIYFCILSSVRDCILNDFDTYQFVSLSGFQKTNADTSRSAIEIQYGSFYVSHYTHRLAEELLRSERIRLKKRKRRYPERDLDG